MKNNLKFESDLVFDEDVDAEIKAQTDAHFSALYELYLGYKEAVKVLPVDTPAQMVQRLSEVVPRILTNPLVSFTEAELYEHLAWYTDIVAKREPLEKSNPMSFGQHRQLMEKIASDLAVDCVKYAVDPSESVSRSNYLDDDLKQFFFERVNQAKPMYGVPQKADRFTRKWVRLRVSAFSRAKYFEELITPKGLATMMRAHCPVTGYRIAQTAKDPRWSNPDYHGSIERIHGGYGYTAVNSSWMCKLANDVRGNLKGADILALAAGKKIHIHEGKSLTQSQWQRMFNNHCTVLAYEDPVFLLLPSMPVWFRYSMETQSGVGFIEFFRTLDYWCKEGRSFEFIKDILSKHAGHLVQELGSTNIVQGLSLLESSIVPLLSGSKRLQEINWLTYWNHEHGDSLYALAKEMGDYLLSKRKEELNPILEKNPDDIVKNDKGLYGGKMVRSKQWRYNL